MVLRRPAVLVAAGLVAVLLVLVASLWLVQRGRVLPNTSIAGVDVSGMTPEETQEAVRGPAEERENDEVVFTFEDERFTLVPEDVGYTIDVDATVEDALARGRRNPVSDVGVRLASYWRDRDLPLVERVEGPGTTAAVDRIADEVDRDRFSGAVEIDAETLEVTTDEPRGSAEVRRDEAVLELEEALRTPGEEELELPVDAEDPPIAPGEVEQVAEQAERAIAEPLVLRVEDESLTLEPTEVATLVEVAETSDGDGLELRVTEEAVEEHLASRAAGTFDQDPVNASYETSRTPPTTFDDSSSTTWSPLETDAAGVVAGREGRRFVPARAAEQLTAAVRDATREIEVEVEVVEPDLPTDEAEDLGPTHLLSTFTTYHATGQTRVANIQRLADVVDGAQVLPGEQFSINQISGERTCSKGYEPAGTIVRGELVDTCGGGVSQFGTTTFNAAFFSGVELDQWQAHSFYISRYPQGREATLSYPELDVRFTNNTGGVIIVRASYTASSITVSLYGQPIASQVSASHGEPYDRRSPTTEERRTSDLPSGERRTVQSPGSDGFRVQVVRRVELLEGGTDEQTITTTYRPQNGIVDVGTG
jgi:vancomycin resistance protein YoaR